MKTTELFRKHFGNTPKVNLLNPNVEKFFDELTAICLEEDKKKSGKIIDRIKTYEDAYEEAPEALRKECEIFSTDTADVVAYKKLKLIIRIINEEWEANWKDSIQRKYWPYFNLASGSGFVFSGTTYGYVFAGTGVGSRLCFESEEKAIYVANQFLSLYKDFLTIK